jgi:hypothetical protein
VAAEILAENFAGDPDVYSRLLQTLPIVRNGTWLFVRPQLAVALCLGWPNSEIIDELYHQELERTGTTEDHQAFFEVRLSRYPVNDFPNLLRRHLEASGVQSNPYIARSLANAATRRITKDEAAAAALLASLGETLEPTEKASVPRLLAAARGLSPHLTAYCVREIEQQLGLESSELGFDVLDAEIRGVYLSLLDTLNGPARLLSLQTEA